MEKEIISEESINNILNGEETENVVFSELSLWEKIKYIFYKAMIYLYKVRCVCCFTSVLAVANILFFILPTGNNSVSDFAAIIIVILGMTGVVSGIIACPLKMIGNVIGLIVGGFTIGLGFAVVGCVIGAMIGVFISFGMVLIAPAVVTIPYYFNELRYNEY